MANMRGSALTTDAKTTIYDLDLREPTAFCSVTRERIGAGILAAASCLARIRCRAGRNRRTWLWQGDRAA